MPFKWAPSSYFRLFISHAADSVVLARELRKQLTDYGIASFVAHEVGPTSGDCARSVNAALSSMDALVALLTPAFNRNEWCNHEVGVAVGRGVHIHAVQINGRPHGLVAAIPQLGMPTDYCLPRLISRFIASDPLASRRLAPGAIEALENRDNSGLLDSVAYLEHIVYPGLQAVLQLMRTTAEIRSRVPPSVTMRLDQLIERWQESSRMDAREDRTADYHRCLV